MFFDKNRFTPGHSQKIYWLWPLIIIVGLFFILHKDLEPTRDMDQPQDYWVRVLLYRDLKQCSVSSSEGFDLHMPDDTVAKFDSDNEFKIETSVYGFKIGEGVFSALSLYIKPRSPYVFKINDMSCRGNLRLVMDEKGTFDAVNYVPMEAYIASVVGAEMPRYWDSDALKAQAIASRTYCLYYKKNYGSNRHYDVRRTQANQVYRGLESEFKNSKKAARATNGIIMTSADEIFPAYFSSSCGGHTADGAKVFGKDFETLKAKPCTYCVKVARKKDFFWKPYRISEEKVNEKLMAKYETIKSLEKVVDIQQRRQTDFGQHSRWTNVRLVGKNGKTITMRGEDLRLTLDPTGMKIKSTVFELANIKGYWVFFSGRGFGHGVGLCQCGAQALARDGYNYQQIIDFFYSNPKMIKLY